MLPCGVRVVRDWACVDEGRSAWEGGLVRSPFWGLVASRFFFNQHTFQLELLEYEKEGISGRQISFTDNEPLLNMFLGKPVGILTLLDEECTFPKATDASFVMKLNQTFDNHVA